MARGKKKSEEEVQQIEAEKQEGVSAEESEEAPQVKKTTPKKEKTKRLSFDEFKQRNAANIINPDDDLSEALGTGSIILDKVTGGGLRRGKWSEFYGAPTSGKTTVAMAVAAQVLKKGGRVVWFDIEQALDIGKKDSTLTKKQARARTWLMKNGINPDDPNLIIFDWLVAEEFYNRVVEIIMNGLADLIVLDSMGALKSMAQIDGDIQDSHYGAMARVNSNGIPRVLRALSISKDLPAPHILIINQQRDNIGSRFGGKKSTGGNSLDHIVRYKLRFSRTANKETEGEVTQTTQVKIEKCGFAPRRKVDIQLSSECGLDKAWEALKYALSAGTCHIMGKSTYYFYSTPLTEDEFEALQEDKQHKNPEKGFLFSARGEGAAKTWLRESGHMVKLYEEAIAALF